MKVFDISLRSAIIALLSISGSLEVVSSVNAQQENHSREQVLALRQVHIRQLSFSLALIRLDSGSISEKDLPDGIPYRAPSNISGSYSKQSKQNIEIGTQKSISNESFATQWGSKMFVLMRLPYSSGKEENPIVVPLYGFTYNVDFGPTARAVYGGSIIAASTPNEVLVSLVGVSGSNSGRIAAYTANLSVPFAFGLYDDSLVRIMTNKSLKPSELISELEFEAPYMHDIASVDSFLNNKGDLLVGVRFNRKGMQQGDKLLERYFLLNLKSKKWIATE